MGIRISIYVIDKYIPSITAVISLRGLLPASVKEGLVKLTDPF